MTMRATELAERLKNADSPCREIDGLIYGLLHGLKRNGGSFENGDKFQFEHPTLRHPNGPGALYVSDSEVPEYTSSIDDALLLQPENHLWLMGCGKYVQYIAECWNPKSGRGVFIAESDANPAIALAWAFMLVRADGEQAPTDRLINRRDR